MTSDPYRAGYNIITTLAPGTVQSDIWARGPTAESALVPEILLDIRPISHLFVIHQL